MKITIAHSPDADDAFMFAPLFQRKVNTRGFEFEEVREDIESLNKKAETGTYDVSAVSFHAYPAISEKYILLSTGACFGENYGPVLISHKKLKPRQALKLRAAIPGKRTTAFLTLRIWERSLAGEGKSGLSYTEVPFDKVMDHVAEKKMDLGLLIHEGQLTFEEKGLSKVVDLGEWWQKETSLPLPLGAIAIRRDLDWETQKAVYEVIRDSIQYALEHREECVQFALPYARGLDEERAKKFIGMYVNEMTVDCGRKGIKAVKELFKRGFKCGMFDSPVDARGAFFNLKRPPTEETTRVETIEETPAEAASDNEVNPSDHSVNS